MYTEQDQIQIRKRIHKYALITVVILAAQIALFVIGLKQRWEAVVMADACAMFAVVCFMWLMFLWPCLRYSIFLKDMNEGLGRKMEGSIVEISQQEDVQDGVRVLPVRIFLESEQDERIVYLNSSKTEGFPKSGEKVSLSCFGRHIKEFVIEK